MSKKNYKRIIGTVYSTNPDYEYEYESKQEATTLPPQQQKLKVMHDRKKRRGKTVTLVTGFVGTNDDLKDLGKKLKSKCGVGGTAKEGEIMVQGEFKKRVHDLLKEMGYSQTKMSGG